MDNSESGEGEIQRSLESDLREEFEAKQPSPAEQQELREAHRHHLVRDTESKLSVDADVDMGGVEVDSVIVVPDTYCFTCDEWVGLSGVDLRGTPRSRKDAYYLAGPPEDVETAQKVAQSGLVELAEFVEEEVERVESVADAAEFVAGELEKVTDTLEGSANV